MLNVFYMALLNIYFISDRNGNGWFMIDTVRKPIGETFVQLSTHVNDYIKSKVVRVSYIIHMYTTIINIYRNIIQTIQLNI